MQGHNKTQYWISKLNLLPHPEGGFYAEVYRSAIHVNVKQGLRPASTSIYYLLGAGDRSMFHRLASDETWYFHDGDPLDLFVISKEGVLGHYLLGREGEGVFPQVTIPAGLWFASRSTGEYTLAGCHVAPGFDFADFEMARRNDLTAAFPHLADTITEFTSG